MADSKEFLETACAIHCASYDSIHDQQLAACKAMLKLHPELSAENIYSAAVTGNLETLGKFLQEPGLAIQKGGPRDWEPLLYLCFSRFLRDDHEPERIERILKCAKLLLDVGADPNAYFMLGDEKETVLYAACGVANNAQLAELLLTAGADVNDEDASYHVAEFDRHDCIRVLFNHGMDARRRATTLLRKLDFDDLRGVEVILKLPTDPNEMGAWGKTALHQAIMRGRDTKTIQLLIDHGADPNLPRSDGKTPYTLAARNGRLDVMELLVAAGASTEIESVVDRIVALCALDDEAGLQALLAEHGDAGIPIPDEDGIAICDAAKSGSLNAVRLMLAAGFDIATQDEQGFSPLHWAAWYGHVEVVKFLVEQQAPLELQNNYGGTVIDSTVWGWTNSDGRAANGREILTILISAGANIEAISPFPTGNAQVDELLMEFGEKPAG